MTPTTVSPSLLDHLQRVQAPLPSHPTHHNPGSAERPAPLVEMASRVAQRLELHHASTLQALEQLSRQHDIHPAELLKMQHQMAEKSARTMIVKQIFDETGRSINSLVNR